MQTRHQIEQLLASAALSPAKRLGQHFLIDLNLMRLLVDSANISNRDIVLEVGAGTGSLTEELICRAGKVIAVELDSSLWQILVRQLATRQNLEVINTDILRNKHTLHSMVIQAVNAARGELQGRLILVSNLPYSIAAPLMVNLAVGPVIADEMHVTVQKEVADRMAALPGSPHYGALSIILNTTGSIRLLRTLRPSVFWPKPRVDSAMVTFIRDQAKTSHITDINLFCALVHLFMNHRRKTLKRCAALAEPPLENITDWDHVFSQASIDPRARGEQLSPQQYVEITGICTKLLQ
ncbi:MAG: 16S rRNA (adenine(1518)-N(6)/adenine(1519)-N(6))-dimethyltransferase RsmA [Planctomycetota bacterium]